MQSALEQIDPMVDRLSAETRKRKLDRFQQLWKAFENIAHHNHSVTEDEFNAHIEKFQQLVFDLFAPVTAQDQEEIQLILNRSHRSANDMERLYSLIERKGANYVFFFKKLSGSEWIPILDQKYYFSNPPGLLVFDDNRMYIPDWPPIKYLGRVVNLSPQIVIDTVLNIGPTNNPLILHTIAEIALKVTSVTLSLKLEKYIFDYMNLSYTYLQTNIIVKLIEKWGRASEDSTNAMLKLIKNVVAFQPDPSMEEKQARHRENPNDWTARLMPAPRVGHYEYQKILKNGIRPFAEHKPYKVACILINAVSTMIRREKHQVELDDAEDGSEFWCRQLDKEDSRYPESKEMLVQTLTFACQQVLEKSPDSIVALDNMLRTKPYLIFTRIRQHLYALYPNEQTKPWIREFILKYEDYTKHGYHYELQRMIRYACEHFGADLLTKQEREKIFSEIVSSPSKSEFREWLGQKFTEEKFQKRKDYFHRKQLRPFACLLDGQYADYYQKLEERSADDLDVSDDDYHRVGKSESGMVSYRSPQSPGDLANIGDENLLSHINQWEEECHDKNDWLVEINIQALAGAFQTVFTETIILAKDRLNFWLQNRNRIQRPVYVRAMVNGMQECIKGGNFEQINQWLDFCEWVLSHPDEKPQDGMRFSDDSLENPNWHSSRRAVGDFVETCLSKEVDAPISARGPLANLLQSLCTQFDWHLDQDEPETLNDLTTDAINTTRGRALESLVNFGFWVHRHDSEAEVPEISTTLKARFNRNAEHPLTFPEYAILGFRYYQIVHLDQKWAQMHKVEFFPHDNFPVWNAAFSAFIKYGRLSVETFEVLKDEYLFALENLKKLTPSIKKRKSARNDIADKVGQHLFMYYLWGMYSLYGKDSLLKCFYEKMKDSPKHWGRLFFHVGRLLRNTSKDLEEQLTTRITKFFDWRFSIKEPKEIKEFTHWMDAECLPAEWRLDSCIRILDMRLPEIKGLFHIISALHEMLEYHPAKVIECFAKITNVAPRNNYVYIDTDKAKAILKVGLESNDESTRQHAEKARENLLRSGRFDFMQLDD